MRKKDQVKKDNYKADRQILKRRTVPVIFGFTGVITMFGGGAKKWAEKCFLDRNNGKLI